MGDDKYNVHDFGTSCGYRIDCENNTVWTGVLGRRGQYDTHTTTLPAGKLNEVLRLVYIGDQRHAQPRAAHAAHVALAEEPKSTRRPKPKASAAPRAPAAPSSETRRTEGKAKPKPKPKKSASPRATAAQPRTAKPATPPRAKATAKPKAASRSTQAGPLTQRTPVSQPSSKPPSHHAAPHVNDAAVLKEIKKNLREGDPSTAEKHFKIMKGIWLGGGREAAVAWMAQHKFPTVVDAFDDWLEKNATAARAMLDRSHAAKHEQVA